MMDIFNQLIPGFWSKILVTLLCAGVIGFERQLRGKPAGIRTSILFCLGTQIFVSLGVAIDFDPTAQARIIGQIITGIGFLGAGVIMGKEGIVKGVTSAAVIWILAAIGAVIGLDYLLVAVVLTLVTVGVLIGVELLEESFQKLRRGVHSLYHDDEKINIREE